MADPSAESIRLDERGLDTAHIVEVGKIAMTAGAIENILAWIAQLLIDPAGHVGAPTLGNLQFAATADLVGRVLPARLTDLGHSLTEGVGLAISNAISEWIGDARAVMRTRNAYLHADWIVTPGTGEALILRRNSEVQAVPLETIRSDADWAAAVAWRGGNLYTNLLGHLGHLDALYEATKAMDPEWFAEQEALEDTRSAEPIWVEPEAPEWVQRILEAEEGRRSHR